MASRASLLQGGVNGTAIVPGKSADSLLLQRITGQVKPSMPMGGARLTDAEVKLLADWIDQGAPWDDVSARPRADGVGQTPQLSPRRPPIPTSTFLNPIDRFLDVYFRQNNVPFADPITDDLFVRRAYMDVWGATPPAAEISAFLNDRNGNKRELLIDRLLGDSEMYTGHWISFWNDLLRNDQGVNYAGTRKTITPWLQAALRRNMPCNQMISELINPVDTPEGASGFLLGVNWRGDVNASQTAYMQAAQNTAQIFLGVNLKCASCHDSFINRYKLQQSYGMAALFSEENSLELVRCDVKTGKRTGPEFLFPELGSIPENTSLAERRAIAAKLFTAPANGRVARTMVNRLWARLLGRGLVEPVDEMDLKPWSIDILDWLAVDFADHGYDLKHTLRQIMTSRAYQMPSIPSANDHDTPYIFRGPSPRRLTAEQFVDTLSSITGEWRILQTDERAVFAREWQLKSTPLSRALGRPIRDQVYTTRSPDATTLQALELVNGETLGLLLRRGAKRMLGQFPPPAAPLFDSKTIRKAVANGAAIDVDVSGLKRLWLLIADVDSYDPSRTVAAWADVELIGPSGTRKLSDLITLSKITPRDITSAGKRYRQAIAPSLSSALIYDIEGLGFERMRGRVLLDDSSIRDDIGPAVRAFIFSAEPDLQQLVAVSNPAPIATTRPALDPDTIVQNIFLQTLCRKPTQEEVRIALALLAPEGKASVKGLEDFLWSMLLHPEMQYVY